MKIEINHLSQAYGKHKVLDNINLIAESGKVTALLGPNGSGKSTLIKTIADILPINSGQILVDGDDITNIPKSDRAKMLGYVPQYFHYTSFTTVLDTVLVGRRPYMSWSVTESDLLAVDKAMSTMHIEDLSGRFVNELSGGQRQRVFIARALAQDPDFYLFDEPTSSLDLRHQLETLSVMQNVVHENNSGIIIALHDLNLALRYADSVVLLKDGQIYDIGAPIDVLTTKAVADVYGVLSTVVDTDNGRFILSHAPTC